MYLYTVDLLPDESGVDIFDDREDILSDKLGIDMNYNSEDLPDVWGVDIFYDGEDILSDKLGIDTLDKSEDLCYLMSEA